MAVAAEAGGQRRIGKDSIQCRSELARILISNPALLRTHWPTSTSHRAGREHRPPQSPRLERHHRKAFVRRRHDQQLGSRDRVEFILICDESEMLDARMFRDGIATGVADQDEVEWPARLVGVLMKWRNDSAQPLFVSIGRIDDERVLQPEFAPRSLRIDRVRNPRTDPTTTPGTCVLAESVVMSARPRRSCT